MKAEPETDMGSPSATDTENRVLKPLDRYYNRQKWINEETKARYAKLNRFEKEAVVGWLKSNLHNVPMFTKSKKIALEQLIAGNYQGQTALFLVRQAFK